jgi:putative aldouronate transport system permease protein
MTSILVLQKIYSKGCIEIMIESVACNKKSKSLWHLIKRDKAFLIMILLPFLYYIIFHYIPMYGIIIAFKDFSIGKTIWGSEWVGFKWFTQFLQSPYLFRLLRNTFQLSLYSILFGFPIPIILALFFNEVRNLNYKRIVQTVSYLPHFISIVIIVGMMVNFLSVNGGIVNLIITQLGMEPIDFMTNPSWFRFLFISSGIWQEAGFGTIIYLAAIAGISQELYDSADVDGCSRFKKNIYITIPCIAPTIIILLILRLGGILSVGFEKIILMYNPNTYEVADVISTYVYRRGILSGDFSFASAVGLFNSLINLVFLIIFNRLAKKVGDISLW